MYKIASYIIPSMKNKRDSVRENYSDNDQVVRKAARSSSDHEITDEQGMQNEIRVSTLSFKHSFNTSSVP